MLSGSSNLIMFVVNSPMNKLIAFHTHFSFLCMVTGISNIGNPPAPIANFQLFDNYELTIDKLYDELRKC